MKANFSLARLFLPALLAWVISQSFGSLHAQDNARQIPDALKPWEDWATWGDQDRKAPTPYQDASTHLPLRRTFEWRNATFKDKDEDAEEYDDYHTIQGLPTPFTLTRYHNGDMASQTFFTKVEYDVDTPPGTFDPNVLLQKKK